MGESGELWGECMPHTRITEPQKNSVETQIIKNYNPMTFIIAYLLGCLLAFRLLHQEKDDLIIAIALSLCSWSAVLGYQIGMNIKDGHPGQ